MDKALNKLDRLTRWPRVSAATGARIAASFSVSMLAAVAILGNVIGLVRGEPLKTKLLRVAVAFVAILLLGAFFALMRLYRQRVQLTAHLAHMVLLEKRLEDEHLALSDRLIRAQEEERNRIGRELHDDLNQQVALLAFGLARLSKNLPPDCLTQVQHLLQQTNRLSSDIHRLSHELHPSVLDYHGLVPAARSLCEEFSSQHDVKVEFVEEDFPTELPHDISLCLFRILQESLNNVSKHSQGTSARVLFAGSPDGVHLTTQDDGVGFDPADERNRHGLGLLSMSERLGLVGGKLMISSFPRHGTTVKAWVPINGPMAIPHEVLISRRPPAFAMSSIGGNRHGARTGTFG
jgi:signal transduction histidine kinase